MGHPLAQTGETPPTCVLPGTFSAPWATLAHSREQYCLAWEAKYLMELGNALETILSGLANMVAQEALKYTMLSGKPPCPHCQRHARCFRPTLVPQLCIPGALRSQVLSWTLGTQRG